MSKPGTPGDPPRSPLIESLDAWEAELDPVQRARLAAARRRALVPAPSPTLGWLPAALAAGVLLALGVGFWPSASVVVPEPAPASLAAGDEDALMDEDSDYLLWLASNDAA